MVVTLELISDGPGYGMVSNIEKLGLQEKQSIQYELRRHDDFSGFEPSSSNTTFCRI